MCEQVLCVHEQSERKLKMYHACFALVTTSILFSVLVHVMAPHLRCLCECEWILCAARCPWACGWKISNKNVSYMLCARYHIHTLFCACTCACTGTRGQSLSGGHRSNNSNRRLRGRRGQSGKFWRVATQGLISKHACLSSSSRIAATSA